MDAPFIDKIQKHLKSAHSHPPTWLFSMLGAPPMGAFLRHCGQMNVYDSTEL